MRRAARSDVLLELHVPDLRRAERFYRRFGFRVARAERSGGGDDYLVLARPSSVLMLWGGTEAVRDHRYFRRFRQTAKRGYGVEIVIPVPDIDAAYATARHAGCVVEDLRMRAWGVRDFRAEDPFGYYLRFTEPHDPARPAARRSTPRRPTRAAGARARPTRSSRGRG
ncbi:MAG: hypothetical protein Q7S41_01415 [Candidatus Limnocylindria bacterium]|nr:hypothetical protein [Candidatus Limnocylindria bacterium]